MIEYFKKMYLKDKESFYKILKKNLKENKKMFIVTANPEAFSYGESDPEYNKLLMDKDTVIVADGIGIVKSARSLGFDVVERIPGIDIAAELLKIANDNAYSIALFGAKEEVIVALKNTIKENYPNIKIVFAHNGYNKDNNEVFKDIIKLKPDICLVALGMPNQEKIIYNNLKSFKKGIFVGVGGSFDVLSGSKKRAPKIFIKTNTEWLYRIIREPKRIKRFYQNNIKFIFKIKKLKKKCK